MYLDINDTNKSKPHLIPFNKYVAGSYFGDSDIFLSQLRDSTAMCLVEVNALVLSKKDLAYLISEEKKVGTDMSILAYERSNVHIERIIDALVKNDVVYTFAHRKYPDLNMTRNTACEFARKYIQKYLDDKIDKLLKLTKNEKIVLSALKNEEVLNSAGNENNESSKDFCVDFYKELEEQKKIEQIKYEREISKYDADLSKMRENAKHIQIAALRIKTNNRMINSRLNDIQETDRIISEKQKSIEDSVYRLLVRFDPGT
jgi:uncharacterized tellurite resistance protein B-like protein